MTAGEAADAPRTWRILGGEPGEDETAAVLAVLTALLLNRSGAPAPEPPRTAAAGWDRAPAGGFRPAGSWRHR
ncbi:acyl-CoA carboxylase subunit epsilon [Streptomyces sp. ISL-94]|uniref:acyl-CoA carboxylase subunit epsilon n=1 Tax=Streptomyces sp. ISL-94 TaxID=2819190 RepID=UPI001BE5FB1E|nr:acyl-CoA carboxylase subunit epsilon [Streptomyces sp. ISL-94]MBT2479883.1 acyl-CoA carboxylase subunit epsilon [Streptomyces sp. ISL-94]